MSNADAPAMAIHHGTIENMLGLTKREHFAAMAMQGALANSERHGINIEHDAETAVMAADALLAALEEKKTWQNTNHKN